jgi:hypothetical protein
MPGKAIEGIGRNIINTTINRGVNNIIKLVFVSGL